MKALHISHAELCEMFHYDPDTGVIRWRHSPRHNVSAGAIAGTITDKGYRRILIGRSGWLAHRIAWFIHHGEDAGHQIDHRNGIKADNRIDNLRKASHSTNKHNTGAQKNNACGAKGVMWCQTKKKWRARIMVDNRRIHLGRFTTKDEAVNAYREAARELVGEFAHPS